MKVLLRRGDAATKGGKRPFPIIAVFAALATVGLGLVVGIVGKGRRRARQHSARSASEESVVIVQDKAAAPLQHAASGASWAIQVYRPWNLSRQALVTELPTQDYAPPQRSPKQAFAKEELLGSDNGRFVATSQDSDVYDSDTGITTACLAPSAPAGGVANFPDDVVLFYEPNEFPLGSSNAAGIIAADSEALDAIAAGLAIHAPYPPTETVIVPRTPDGFSALLPPPRISHSCSSHNQLRAVESWTSVGVFDFAEATPEATPGDEPCDDVWPDLADPWHEARGSNLDSSSLVVEPGCGGFGDGLRPEGPRSPQWPRGACLSGEISVNPVSSSGSGGSDDDGGDGSDDDGGDGSDDDGGDVCDGDDGGDGDGCDGDGSDGCDGDGSDGCDGSDSGSGFGSCRSSQLGLTSDDSSLGLGLGLPGPDSASGGGTPLDVRITVTLTLGNPLFVKSLVGGAGDGAAAAPAGRARRRLSFDTTVDNPCFAGAGAVTAMNNPCFSSDEHEGAVPALLPLPEAAVEIVVNAASRTAVNVAGAATAVAESATGPQWYPRNPLADDRAPHRFGQQLQQPPQKPLPLQQPQEPPQQQQQPRSQHQQELPMTVDAAAEVPAPPVTPAKPSPPFPPLAAAACDSPTATPPAAAPAGRRPPDSVAAAEAPVGAAAATTVNAACLTDAVSFAVTAASAASTSCSASEPERLSNQFVSTAEASVASPQPPQQHPPQPHRAVSPPSAILRHGGPPSRHGAAKGPAPRPGPGSAETRPPWRPTACPHASTAKHGGASTAASTGRRCYESVRSSITSLMSKAATHQHPQARAPAPEQTTTLPPRPPFRPTSKRTDAFQPPHANAATRGSAAGRVSAEWVPGIPGFMRPTQAFLAAASAAGSAGAGEGVRSSVAGGSLMRTGGKDGEGRRGEAQRVSDNRPRWR